VLVIVSCEDDIDEGADIEKKAEDGDVVIVEGRKNGMTSNRRPWVRRPKISRLRLRSSEQMIMLDGSACYPR